MNTETKNCQNCKASFEIDAADFLFYQKMQVPPPTFCPECRMQRRFMFRNERSLYKRNCDLCGKSMITIFSPDKPYKVFCSPCWWSDNWDGTDYSLEYDPSRNFFEQFRELYLKTPFANLVNGYTTLVNSEYVNHAGYAKNCYLIFNSDQCENVMYSSTVNYDKDSADMLLVDQSELCYELINGNKCYNVFFSEDCRECTNIYFSKNLISCTNCFGCINLRGKNYHVFNKSYTKENYESEIKKISLDSWKIILELDDQSRKFWQKHPRRFMQGTHNVNVSGDYVSDSKNAHAMYQSKFVEDGKFSQFLTIAPIKDVYDFTEWGNNAQRIYEAITVGEGADNIKFTFGSWGQCLNNEYALFVVSSSNTFGCVNLRKKIYCILNKQYPEDEYKRLREKIIKDLDKNPYVDQQGRIWKYGEFFPYDLSLFSYNETIAAQYFPLSKEKVLEKGWKWKDTLISEHKITLSGKQLPDSIHDVSDDILKEVLGCFECGKAFRLIKPELDLLRRFGFPIPRKCPNCRHMDRMKKVNPPKLWDRNCAKCNKDIKTSYAPERPEMVYCETCYQAEVV